MTAWKALTTEQRIAAIKTAHPDTIGTAKSVADALSRTFRENISRSTVMSYYHRYEDKLASVPLTGKAPVKKVRVEKAPAKKAATTQAPTIPKKIKHPSALLAGTGAHFTAPKKYSPPVLAPAKTVAIPVPKPLLLKLYELERLQCKWPVQGDRENTLFCGNATVGVGPYCACHKAMSIGVGTRGERMAVPARRAA